MIINNNIYQLNHEKVACLTGEVTFLGTFCRKNIDNDNTPWAWYTAWNPDRSRDHKDFVGIRPSNNGAIITGANWDDFERHLTVPAVQCRGCEDVIYSSYRHHQNYCTCGNSFVDGGCAYSRVGGMGSLGKLNLLLQVLTLYGKI